MKNFKYLIGILGIVILFFYSCENDDSFTTPDPTSGWVDFARPNFTGETGSVFQVPVRLNAPVNTSGLQVNYSLVPISGPNPNTVLNDDGVVDIPMGEQVGFISFDLTNINESMSFEIVIESTNKSNVQVGISDQPEILTSTIVTICQTIDPTFGVGTYLLQSSIPCANGDCFGNPVVVEVVQTEGRGRSFDAVYLAQFGIGQPAMTFRFEFGCESIDVLNAQATNLGCGGGSLQIGPAENPSSIPATDQEIIINFTDNILSSCDLGPVQAQIILTRI